MAENQYKLNYDEINQVVNLDLEGVTVTKDVVDGIANDVRKIFEQKGQKVYILAHWADASLDPTVADYYGTQMAASKDVIAQIVRYEAKDPFSNISIRAQTVRNHLQGSRSNIYATKEEALAAINQAKEAETIS